MTTKLEELARSLRDMSVDYEHEDSDRNKMQHEMRVAIETALKPLLDAARQIDEYFDSPEDGIAQHVLENWREQLSQWRPRTVGHERGER